MEILRAERQKQTLDEPYMDPYIPQLAKAMLPMLRAALAKRKTLYDGFAGSRGPIWRRGGRGWVTTRTGCSSGFR